VEKVFYSFNDVFACIIIYCLMITKRKSSLHNTIGMAQ
ncbi:uncharacterized protein METZ01_LOCUS499988, partial [marine metagenome]